MEKEKFLEQEPETSSIIDEPHFEEAWTVLSARPVVPLKEVGPSQNRQTLGRAAKLLAAFVGAGLLGVLVALASIRFRQLPATPGQVPVQSDALPTAQEPTSTSGQAAIEPEVEAAPVKTSSQVTEVSKGHARQNAAPVQVPGSDGDSSSSKPQLADEWQERRPRRTTLRRHREIDELHHRDLLRIQEIFEGRRPRNP